MKSILISIKPEWVEKILKGEKTIEIRKSMPKCELPCKVYIYCTKGKPLTSFGVKSDGFVFEKLNGKVVAEFTLKQAEKIIYLTDRESVKKHGCWECKLEDKWKIENGFNKSQFNPEDYSNYYTEGSDDNYLIFYSKVTGTELHKYLKGQTGYAWHIDDLVIYDTPKDLSEFKIWDKTYDNVGAFGWAFSDEQKYTQLKRPPQSWCYIEEMNKD